MKKPKVFCIGLSRTGTTSIHHCLEMLGYSSVHFPLSLFAFPENINTQYRFTFKATTDIYGKWRAAKEIKTINARFPADRLFQIYDAFSDLPIPLFYKELYEKFPDSKFIYTTRSLEKWLTSMQWMFTDGRVLWNWGYLHDEILLAVYGSTHFDKEQFTTAFIEHEKAVFQFFKDKPGCLLIINLEEKQPIVKAISDFLGIPAPQTDFPKVNEKIDVSKKQRILYFLKRHIPFFYLVRNLKIK